MCQFANSVFHLDALFTCKQIEKSTTKMLLKNPFLNPFIISFSLHVTIWEFVMEALWPLDPNKTKINIIRAAVCSRQIYSNNQNTYSKISLTNGVFSSQNSNMYKPKIHYLYCRWHFSIGFSFIHLKPIQPNDKLQMECVDNKSNNLCLGERMNTMNSEQTWNTWSHCRLWSPWSMWPRCLCIMFFCVFWIHCFYPSHAISVIWFRCSIKLWIWVCSANRI